MISKIISGIIAVVYLRYAYSVGGPESTLKCATILILPLACIWYSDAMGSYTGVMYGRGISSETPGCVVACGGWLLLLLPLIASLIGWLLPD